MIIIYFLYGLSFFSLSLVVFLEARRTSQLPLGRQLAWLGAFGLTHSLVEWTDMFILLNIRISFSDELIIMRSVLLPLSAILLVRFGIGLIQEAGPLPFRWLAWVPVLLILPSGILLGYVLTVFSTEPPWDIAADVWSRYLIYFPGNLFASIGFFRQWHGLKQERLKNSRNLLLGAAIAFFINAFIGGLVVPKVPYGFGPWLNYQWLLDMTGIAVQIWRTLSAMIVTIFVVKALDVFETERRLHVFELEEAHSKAQMAIVDASNSVRVNAENWTNALVKISRCIAEIENTDQVLTTILQTAQQLLLSDTAVLALWDENGENLNIQCHVCGLGKPIYQEAYEIDPVIVEAMRDTQSRCYPNDFPNRSEPLYCPFIKQEIKAAILMPLKLESQPFGGIWVGRVNAKPFSVTEIIGLESLADQTVIAVTHALMVSRLQSLAVIEERNRIGREMHDSLAQVLGYLRLETQTMEALVYQGNNDAVISKIKQVRQNIDIAHADVRENILSLRTTLSNDAGIISALSEYLKEFSLHTSIKVAFENSFNNDLNLSPIAETQMVRIVQEALANVRKHSQAKNVLFRLDGHTDCLCVTITDDGIGFDQKSERRKFGLQTMRERAESVGGGLSIDAKLGSGTQINLWLPLLQRQSLNRICKSYFLD